MLLGLLVGVTCCVCLLMCWCVVPVVYCGMLYGVCYDCVCLCVLMCVFPFVIDGVMLNGSFIGCVFVVLVPLCLMCLCVVVCLLCVMALCLRVCLNAIAYDVCDLLCDIVWVGLCWLYFVLVCVRCYCVVLYVCLRVACLCVLVEGECVICL